MCVGGQQARRCCEEPLLPSRRKLPRPCTIACCQALWGGSALAALVLPDVFRPGLSVGMLVCRLAAGREALHRSATAKEVEAAPALAQDALQGLVDNLSAAGADAAEARARKILLGLGFTTGQLSAPVSWLSGEDCHTVAQLLCPSRRQPARTVAKRASNVPKGTVCDTNMTAVETRKGSIHAPQQD